MSRADNTLLSLPCDYCGAKPGEWCRSRAGRATNLHSARYYAAQDAGLLPAHPDTREEQTAGAVDLMAALRASVGLPERREVVHDDAPDTEAGQ